MKNIWYISFIKTIRFNFHYFKFKGLYKLPVLVARGVQIKSLRGNIFLDKMRPNILNIGFPSLGTKNDSTTKGCIDINGSLIIHDNTRFCKGSSVSIAKNAIIEIGSLRITGDTNLIAQKKVTIGNDVLVSWGGYIMDSDFHHIFNERKELINPDSEIIIGDDVWIGMNCSVLKGSLIPNGSVIAAGSIITKKLSEKNAIYVNNNPIKHDIYWKA